MSLDDVLTPGMRQILARRNQLSAVLACDFDRRGWAVHQQALGEPHPTADRLFRLARYLADRAEWQAGVAPPTD